MATLRGLLPGGERGMGRFVTITGEPGMGKTRLLEEFAHIAGSLSNRVLWSQMMEDPGAPPYFCWTLALRAYFQQADDQVLNEDLGSGAADVAAVVPELRNRLALDVPDGRADNATSRYQQYDAVSCFLNASARRQPLVLLFDNLHSADRSSLALLEYVVQQISGSAILIVGAFRESEVGRRHPLRHALNRLARSAGHLHVELPGLSRKDVAELLHSKLGYVPPATLVTAVHEQSDGNPLFVSEVGTMLGRVRPEEISNGAGLHFRVPQSLADVIGARLDALADDVYELLKTAAVLGRDFELTMLAELAAATGTQAARRLHRAERAGVVVSLGPGRYRFHHAVYREVLYEEHSAIARVMLHKKAGEHIEARYADSRAEHLSELAFHFYEAAQAGGEEKAILYCRWAAEAAVQQRAYGEAVTLLGCALQASELERDRNAERFFELQFDMGRAEYLAGELNAANQTLIKAAILAYRNQWWRQLSKALFLFQLLCQQSGYHHVSAVPLHKALLENLPADDAGLRPRVLASLAKAYRTAGEQERAIATFHEAVDMARVARDDGVLLDCLRKGSWVVGRPPAGVREGLEVSREALELAREKNDALAALDSEVDIIFQLCELGEIEEVEQRLELLAQLSRTERQPHFRNVHTGFETAVAILRGDWLTALKKTREGVRRLPLQGVRGLRGRFAFQMFAICRARGALEPLKYVAEQIVAGSDADSLWRPGQVLLYCELGEYAKARDALNKLGELSALPDDDLLEVSLVYLAESCLALGDSARCRELYDLLLPYRGLNITLPAAFMLGSAAGFLARLAQAIGRNDEAVQLYEEALTMNLAMRAAPALAHCQIAYAEFLMDSDRQRAAELLSAARFTADALDLAPALHAIDGLGVPMDAGKLTTRELDVLRIIARGSSNKRIAEQLNISHSTVTTHVRNIFRKISVANRTEAADYARRSGLLEHEHE